MGEAFQTPRLETVIAQIVEQRLILSHGGGFPAKITAWDGGTGRATVEAHFQLQPAPTPDEPAPAPESVVVENVRVLFPSVGGWSVRAASMVGESVWCMGAARSLEQIDTWQASGKAAVPSPPRVMALDDMVAIPVSWGGGSTTSLVIEGHNTSIELTPAGKVLLNGGGDGVARVGDSVSSTSVDSAVFWTWIAAVDTILQSLGLSVPAPTSLSSKITSGSSTVEAS